MCFATGRKRLVAFALPGSLGLMFGLTGLAQQAIPGNPAQPPARPGTAQEATPPAAAPSSPAIQQPASAAPEAPASGRSEAETPLAAPAAALSANATEGISEEQLKKLLVGRDLYLRGGYLGDFIGFNEHGKLNGHAPTGSYTLCAVRIDRIHLSKHKVELVGARYGLHFLGELPYADPTKAMDRVMITPKKKELRLAIDREVVVKPKKAKAAKTEKRAKNGADAAAKTEAGAATEPAEMSDADQLKAEIAATPAADRPGDAASVTTTTSPAHATKVLMEALNNVLATGLDDRMLAGMPKFWQRYYQAALAKSDYRPADPAVLRQNMVDQKAKLLTNFEPASNEYAQANGVAGMALYHVVIGPDGKPGEIAVARPIGFGLDESAVDAIQKASFSAAVKDGKPVPVLLDLVVQFRIYSKRTSVLGAAEPADKAVAPALPGPYSAAHP